jgi:heptosyltransferase-1
MQLTRCWQELDERAVRVLIVKMSSLGDVIHTLPALTDAHSLRPEVRFDWVVEEAFAEIPRWHPAVDQVIPVALRRWRKNPLAQGVAAQWTNFRRALRQSHYDLVIDAQGLLKSAFVARLVSAPSYGMDKRSAREGLAASTYDHPVHIPRDQHAVERIRQLFADALNYTVPGQTGDYGLSEALHRSAEGHRSGVLLFHGTARAEKQWPEQRWIELQAKIVGAGHRVWLPWGNDEERARADRIAASQPEAQVLPRLGLSGLATLLLESWGAVAVDTGLGHLAAALDVPAVSLYGPTDTRLIGAYGMNQLHLEAPLSARETNDPQAMMASITADAVWEALQSVAGSAH